MSRVLHAFAALGVALVTAQKFPARPIPQTLTERVDGALEELLAATAEDPAFAAVEGGEGAQAFEERLAKLELAFFGDGDKEDGVERRIDDLEEAFTDIEKAAELLKAAPSVEDSVSALSDRLDALEQAATAPPAAPSVETPKSASPEGSAKTKAGAGPADAKLV